MLRLYNTMSRSVEDFKPYKGMQVGLYTCGPTVYNYAHLGNLRTYVFEDILKRTLEFCGYQVNHVMNVTDVGHLVSDADEGEDKMELGAAREGKTVWDIAEFYFEAFKTDMARLNLQPPNTWCKATDHIQEQIDMVAALEAKGLTYTLGDGVYFDTFKLTDYGKLARLDISGLRAGARIDVVQGKKNLTDFALWKISPTDKKRLMEWDSPWGVGFPGWHVECSAMSLKYLGPQLDIHCGGVDHVAVHHTNEIAQTENVTGQDWGKYWMHAEFLTVSASGEDQSQRMSKSAGNFLRVDTLVERGFDPLVYRYFCLSGHYRQQLAFSWDAIQAAATGFERLKTRAIELREHADPKATANNKHMTAFREAIEDDLNMPRGLAAAWTMLKDGELSPAEHYATLGEMDRVLGFDFANIQAGVQEPLEQEIQDLIEQRIAARASKDFAKSDEIRDRLAEMGIELKDTAQGTTWKKK